MCEFSFARSSELVDPTPIVISQSIDIEKIEGAIYAAMVTNRWARNKPTITEPNGKSLEAIYSVRAHTIITKITFDSNEIKLLYVDSVNMNYKNK
jgi:hypothetical protein